MRAFLRRWLGIEDLSGQIAALAHHAGETNGQLNRVTWCTDSVHGRLSRYERGVPAIAAIARAAEARAQREAKRAAVEPMGPAGEMGVVS